MGAPGDGKRHDRAKVTPLRAAVPCPRCGQPSRREAYPFCSKRCADVDLAAWLGGGYAIAVEEADTSVPNASPRAGDEGAADPLDKRRTRE